ncbi:hypothetical protein HGM15179_005828, partial [Zosterops borbonicus]
DQLTLPGSVGTLGLQRSSDSNSRCRPPGAPTHPPGTLVMPGKFLCPCCLSPAPLQPEASSPFPASCCQGKRT